MKNLKHCTLWLLVATAIALILGLAALGLVALVAIAPVVCLVMAALSLVRPEVFGLPLGAVDELLRSPDAADPPPPDETSEHPGALAKNPPA